MPSESPPDLSDESTKQPDYFEYVEDNLNLAQEDPLFAAAQQTNTVLINHPNFDRMNSKRFRPGEIVKILRHLQVS